MMARSTGCDPGEFVPTFAQVRLCLDHLEPADEQRAPEPSSLRRLHLRREPSSQLGCRCKDVGLVGHRRRPIVRAAVSG